VYFVCFVVSYSDAAEKITSLQNPRIKQLVKLRDRGRATKPACFSSRATAKSAGLGKSVALQELYYAPDWFSGERAGLIAQAEPPAHGCSSSRKTPLPRSPTRTADGLLAVAPQWKRTLEDLAGM